MRSRLASLAALLVLIGATPAAAQITIERTPHLSGGWVATPGALELSLRPFFSRREGGGLNSTFGVSGGYGLIPRLMLGGDVAIPIRRPRGTETDWQLFARYRMLDAEDDLFDIAVTGGYNGMVRSWDAELSMARWFGPGRAIGVLRGFSDAYGLGETRFVLGAGAAVHPFARRAPVAISGEFVTLTRRRAGQDPAWTVSAQSGLFSTRHTVAVYATNSFSQTLQGSSVGVPWTRVGFEFTLRLPVGPPLGLPPARSGAGGVVQETTAAAGVVTGFRNFAFLDRTIEVAAGAVVEWHNADAVVHTVNADDGSWRSGAIRPGRSWRAVFTRPGRYPFYCGPHPYMRGVVIVH